MPEGFGSRNLHKQTLGCDFLVSVPPLLPGPLSKLLQENQRLLVGGSDRFPSWFIVPFVNPIALNIAGVEPLAHQAQEGSSLLVGKPVKLLSTVVQGCICGLVCSGSCSQMLNAGVLDMGGVEHLVSQTVCCLCPLAKFTVVNGNKVTNVHVDVLMILQR